MSSSIDSSRGTGARLRRFPASVLALATVVLLVASAGDAGAKPVSCGDRITADTTLHKDLRNCPNKGLAIAADNVTLDLNGHTIDGDHELVDPCPMVCDIGIWVRGKHGVTIEGGGKVKEFGFGVFLYKGKRNRVKGTASVRNHFNGLLLVGSKNDRVTGTRTNSNGLTVDYPGIALINSKRVRMRNVTSSRNADLGLFSQGTNRSRFIGNTFSHDPEAGALIEGNRNVIAHNRVIRDGDGLNVTGNRNVITRNLVERAHGCGRFCGNGITLDNGHNNVIAFNKVVHTRTVGIRMKTFVKEQFLRNNVLLGNLVDRSRGRGLQVGPGVKHVLLRANHVIDSKDAGIHVASPSVKLIGNHSNGNGDLGIAAVKGVVDGGGNVAHNNGTPRQCKHVACS